MASETLATAQVEIVASLDGLSDGLEQARDAVVGTMDTVDERVSVTGRVFESAFASAGDRMLTAIVGAGRAKDAWLSLGNAALGLAEDVERLILQLTVLDPLLNTLFGAGGSLPTLAGSPLGDLFSGAGASIPGQLAQGAAFDPGGSGVANSGAIALRATTGERVSIGSSSHREAAGATTNVVVHNYASENANVERRRNIQGGEDITVTIGKVIARDFRTNGPAGQALRQHYGASTVPIQR